MDTSNVFHLSLKAGGLAWILSGILMFIPLWYELAYPLWGKPGRLADFTLRSLLVLICSTFPGGGPLAAALFLKIKASEILATEGLAQPLTVPVPSGATLPEGCP